MNIPQRTWYKKFSDAFRGVWLGVRGERSFYVHLATTVVVVLLGVALRVSRLEWCLLALCIITVLVAEMFNSAIERLAKAIDEHHNPRLGDALDVGSAAVLLASIGACIVGLAVFLFRFGLQIGWWES